MLCQMIDEYLKNRPRDPRQNRCFHPSWLHKSEKELHRLFCNEDEQEFPPRVLRIFDNGHHVHERIQEYLTEAGVLLQAEVPLENKKYEIQGTCDGVVKIGDREGILEIKSINQNQFYSLHEPKLAHLIQINVYMFLAEIPQGVLLYECKDNQQLKNFFIKQNPEILDPVLEKIKRVQQRIKRGID